MLEESIKPKPKAVELIAVGHGGLAALQALAKLRNDYHIPEDNLRIDRGAMYHVYPNSNKFVPMLHSKIYYAELPEGRATAYIGSHNLTEYAIAGSNCEAGVRLRGPRSKPQFEKIRQHIAQIRSKTIKFDPNMIDQYVWLQDKYLDSLKEGKETYQTSPIMVIAAEPQGGLLPSPGETVYFEVPQGDKDFDRFRIVEYRVNIHLVPSLSSIPSLRSLSGVRGSIVAGHIHLSNETGKENTTGRVVSLPRIDWIIDDIRKPVLRKGSSTTSAAGTKALQVNIVVDNVGVHAFDYSPPDGYDYKAFPSDRRVLSTQSIESFRSDDVFGRRLSSISERLFALREIESIEKISRREGNESKEWKGTKRLRLKEDDLELTMWHTNYSRQVEDESDSELVLRLQFYAVAPRRKLL